MIIVLRQKAAITVAVQWQSRCVGDARGPPIPRLATDTASKGAPRSGSNVLPVCGAGAAREIAVSHMDANERLQTSVDVLGRLQMLLGVCGCLW